MSNDSRSRNQPANTDLQVLTLLVFSVLQSPVRHGQTQNWIPLVANHFPVSSPFTDELGQPQPLLNAHVPASVPGVLGVPGMPLTSLAAGVPGVPGVPVSGVAGVGLQVPSSMALVPVPVIVPVLAPPPTLHQARSRSLRRAGGGPMPGSMAGPPASSTVKFEATPV